MRALVPLRRRYNRFIWHHVHAVQGVTLLSDHIIDPIGIVFYIILSINWLILGPLALLAALALRYPLQLDPLHFARFDLAH